MSESKEVQLDALSKQDVIYCAECAILILKHVRKPERRPPLIGEKAICCPVCGSRLLSVEDEEPDWWSW